MKILVLAEHDTAQLDAVGQNVLGAAQQLGGDIDILVAGHEIGAIAEAASKIEGVNKVLQADDSALAHQLAEPMSELLQKLAGDYDVIVAAASSNGSNIMPRLAALLDVMPITGVIDIIGTNQFVRPIYAGNALQTVEALEDKKLITVRPTSFKASPLDGNSTIEQVTIDIDAPVSTYISRTELAPGYVDLAAARRVVSGGRALGSADAFVELIDPLAKTLGAAKGATRAAVDAGYVANDWQVGQTGRVVAPELYIAIGISGAVQHTAGMSGSKVIVAINQDPEAPIFNIADYGIVGDLFEIVPQLQAALDAHFDA